MTLQRSNHTLRIEKTKNEVVSGPQFGHENDFGLAFARKNKQNMSFRRSENSVKSQKNVNSLTGGGPFSL